MKFKFFQAAVVLAILLASFYAIYYKETPQIQIEPLPQESIKKDSQEEPLQKIESESPIEEPSEIERDPFAKPIEKPVVHVPATFNISVKENEAFNVAIIGESLAFDLTVGHYDKDTLLEFSKMLSNQRVKAIFLTGSFDKNRKLKTEEENSDVKNDLVEQDQFDLLYPSNKESIPLFPTLNGNSSSPLQAKQVLNQFDEANAFDDKIGYTVSIGEAFFAVISESSLRKNKNEKRDSFSKDVQTWLNLVLASAKKDHRFLFVTGHEPAFFSSTIFSDKNTANHDQFWKILVGNGVQAYFSSREHFYDRSYRYGVWQLVSSGGETILTSDGVDAPFFHCLMLTIPSERDGVPKVQVLDIEGNVIDSFELKKKAEPLYQMRIY